MKLKGFSSSENIDFKKLKFYRNVYGIEIEMLKCKSIYVDKDFNFYRCQNHFIKELRT